jgi:hypothetical protein
MRGFWISKGDRSYHIYHIWTWDCVLSYIQPEGTGEVTTLHVSFVDSKSFGKRKENICHGRKGRIQYHYKQTNGTWKNNIPYYCWFSQSWVELASGTFRRVLLASLPYSGWINFRGFDFVSLCYLSGAQQPNFVG